ncbi:MAG: hypothetical protein MJE77_46340 [Proteobacteria bacterium]|nr:hypothetical protein [Pseudomonadota bacterium]
MSNLVCYSSVEVNSPDELFGKWRQIGPTHGGPTRPMANHGKAMWRSAR